MVYTPPSVTLLSFCFLCVGVAFGFEKRVGARERFVCELLVGRVCNLVCGDCANCKNFLCMIANSAATGQQPEICLLVLRPCPGAGLVAQPFLGSIFRFLSLRTRYNKLRCLRSRQRVVGRRVLKRSNRLFDRRPLFCGKVLLLEGLHSTS